MTPRSRFLAVSLLVCAALSAASWVAAQSRKDTPDPDSLYKYLSVFSEVLGLVRHAYVEDTEVQRLMSGAYEGTADALGTFTVYVPADRVAEFRRVRSTSSRSTGLLMVRERGWIYVAGVADGSVAELAGFERGDLVAKVDGEATRDLQVWEIEAHLQSRAGVPVAVTVLRQGENHDLTLPAGGSEPAPEAPAVAVERVREVPVLRITRFDAETAPAVGAELKRLAQQGAGKLLVDLRGTGGGDAEAAYRVGELLVSGELGTLKRRDEVRTRYAAAGTPAWRGELAVLIDRGTLGAAEVLASVLDQGAKATLVGEPSFGHAGRTAQIELSSGALLELTDAFYTGPDGELLDESLEPDLVVDERSRRLGERELTVDELILQRGIGVLSGEEQKKAA
jgi:carboxyl-terminal processing protease